MIAVLWSAYWKPCRMVLQQNTQTRYIPQTHPHLSLLTDALISGKNGSNATGLASSLFGPEACFIVNHVHSSYNASWTCLCPLLSFVSHYIT